MGSYAQGAQASGSTPTPDRDVGYGVFCQTINIQAAGNATKDFVAYLPDGAQIVDVKLDTTTLHTSASATLSGGTTVGGTDLWSATNVLSAGRASPAFTAPQLSALQALPHTSGQPDTPVNMRLALGTPTSVGTTKVLLMYSLKLQ